jgi:hypothetical protein
MPPVVGNGQHPLGNAETVEIDYIACWLSSGVEFFLTVSMVTRCAHPPTSVITLRAFCCCHFGAWKRDHNEYADSKYPEYDEEDDQGGPGDKRPFHFSVKQEQAHSLPQRSIP